MGHEAVGGCEGYLCPGAGFGSTRDSEGPRPGLWFILDNSGFGEAVPSRISAALERVVS